MLRIDDISLLYADEVGKIWIGVDERLLDGNGKIVLQMPAAIQSITEDQQGQIWIASQNQICCRAGEKWQRFDLPEDREIRSIRLDQN